MQSTNLLRLQPAIYLFSTMYAVIAFLLLTANPLAARAENKDETHPVQISIAPHSIEQGNVALLRVTCPSTITAISYKWQDAVATLSIDAQGLFSGLVPIGTQQKPGKTGIAITLRNSDNESTVMNASFVVKEKDFHVQHITVDESKANLSKKNLERHTSERKLIVKMFSLSQPRKLWEKSFSQPLQGRISTPFGVKRFINDEPRSPHSGVDIAAPSGTPVKATADGVVSLTGEHFFAGKSVYIDHGDDIFSMYFHLDSIAVQDGQTVAKDDIIGKVGATGRATGPHLHWGVRIHDTPIDPFSLLALFEK